MIVQPWSAFAPNPHLAWYSQKRMWIVYVVLVYLVRLCLGVAFRDNVAWALTNVFHALVWDLTTRLSPPGIVLLLPLVQGTPFSPLLCQKRQTHNLGTNRRWSPLHPNKESLFAHSCLFVCFHFVIFAWLSRFLIAVQSDTTFSIFLFSCNLAALVLCIIPALPVLHRARPFGFNTD